MPRPPSIAEIVDLLGVVLRGLTDGVTAVDPAGRMIYANDAAARLCGYADSDALRAAPPGEILARFDLFREDGSPLPLTELPTRIVLGGGAPTETLIRWHDRATREDRWSLVSASAVPDEGGAIRFAISIFKDVSERVRQEARSRLLADASRAFAEAGVEVDRVLDAIVRRIVEVVGDGCSIRTLSEDGALNVHRATWHRDPDALAAALHPAMIAARPAEGGYFGEVLRTGRPVLVPKVDREALLAQYRAAGIDGQVERVAPQSLAILPLRTAGRVFGVIATSRTRDDRPYDENERLLLEELADRAALAIENARLYGLERSAALERARHIEDLSRTVRFSEMFVGILGHDLRNPLSAIMTAAALLQRRADSEKVSKPASRILTSAGRMARMIDQLLDLTRIRLGQGIPLELRTVDLTDVCRVAVEEIGSARGRRDIEIRSHGDASGTWDGDRLSQLVSNLLSNAIDHGDPETAPSVVVEGEDPDSIVLRVKNGGQIPRELQPVLFEPFRSGGEGRFERTSGLGLGLYISQQIALAHGGTIEATSSRAGGTCLTVRLPRHPRERASFPGPEAK